MRSEPGDRFDVDEVWLRIERRGDLFVGSYSPDGKSWTPVHEERIPALDGPLLGGIGAGGGDARDGRPGFMPLEVRASLTLAAPLLRADCNGDGSVDVSDASCGLDALFGAVTLPGCLAALDTNGDGDVNIVDPVSLLNFLFGEGDPPVAPFPECGPGTLLTDEQLGCVNPPGC